MKENTHITNKTTWKKSVYALLLLIPAFIFGILSAALAYIGLGLIPLVPAVLALIFSLVSWFLLKRKFRIFTWIIFIVAGISILYSFITGVFIERKVLADETFDSTITTTQEGIGIDLADAFSDELFEADSLSVAHSNDTINRGEALYLSHCAACHMQNGQGIESTYPPLAGADYLVHTNKVIESVLFGLTGKITVNGISYNKYMPASDLNDDEAMIVINYIFSAWGNNLPAITIDQVIEVRNSKKK
jgi:nitrite reductase (NO-forming)